jgi:hypothetical protein
MGETTKKCLKMLGVGVIWVYILSINIGGKTIFSYANDILVQNRIVDAIDQTLAGALESVSQRVGLSSSSGSRSEQSY